METALDAGGHDVTGIADAEGFTASVSGDAGAKGAGRISGDAAAAGLKAGSLEAGALGAASLTVSADLLVGRAAAGSVSAGTAGDQRPSRSRLGDCRRFAYRRDPGGGRHSLRLRPLLGAETGGGDADGKRHRAIGPDLVHRPARSRCVHRRAHRRELRRMLTMRRTNRRFASATSIPALDGAPDRGRGLGATRGQNPGAGRGLCRARSPALNRRHCLGRSLGHSRGLSRGLSLFGSLLALGLLGAMVLAAALFFENRAMDERARLAARQLTVLSDAAASHVSGRFPAMLTAPRRRLLRAHAGRAWRRRCAACRLRRRRRHGPGLSGAHACGRRGHHRPAGDPDRAGGRGNAQDPPRFPHRRCSEQAAAPGWGWCCRISRTA